MKCEDVYFPIFDNLGCPRISLKEIYNPKGVIYGLKASRKKIMKGGRK